MLEEGMVPEPNNQILNKPIGEDYKHKANFMRRTVDDGREKVIQVEEVPDSVK